MTRAGFCVMIGQKHDRDESRLRRAAPLRDPAASCFVHM